MPDTIANPGRFEGLRRVVWLPFSLLWGGAVLAGMYALDFVFRNRQLRKPQGGLWLLLSISYWILAAVFTGEWEWKKDKGRIPALPR